MRSLFLLLALLTASCASVPQHREAVDPATNAIDHLPSLAGDYFPADSSATGRRYHMFVRLPQGYDPNAATRYPVVYVLDGDTLFPILAATHLFLNYDEKLPEAIVVGIAYGGFDPTINKRDIDYTAPAADAKPGQDGAPRFLAFLKNELVPSIEKRYNTDPAKRVLLGQSRGGYFALWSALEAPDLFWARIASNPTLAPGRARFFSAPAPHTAANLKVAVASGSRDTDERRRNAREWTDAWRARPDAPWQVELFPIDGGTHSASIGETYRRTMLWLFRDDMRNGAAAK